MIKLSKEEIKTESGYLKAKKIVDDLIMHHRQGEAVEFLLQLQEELKETDLESLNPELFSRFNKLLIRLKLTAIPALPEDQVFNIIEKHFIDGLKIEYIKDDLFDRIRIFLMKYPIEVRDEHKEGLRKALEMNTQKIGEEKLKIAGEKTPKEPTVKYWLKDYIDFLGAGKHTRMDRARYLYQSPNCKTLSEKDRRVLDKLLEFYDIIKISSWKVGAIDNYSPEAYGFFGPKAVRMPVPVEVPLMPPKEISKAPPKPAVAPPVVPPKPAVEIEKEIEAKRKAEEERIARLEREMRPKVPPPPKVEIAKPPEIPKPEVAPPPKIKPAPSFPPRPTKPARPPRIEAALPTEPVGPPPKPRVPVKIESVDDIKRLSASDFRGYTEVPRDSARAITEKINSLLAEASPLDRIKALSFWKESDLYKLYIEMGRESMAQEKTVKELAEERRAEGKPYLSHEEFEAIAEISGAIG